MKIVIHLLSLAILFFSYTLYSKESSKQVIEVLLSSDNYIYEQALYGIQTSLDYEVRISYLDVVLSEYNDPRVYFQEIEATGSPLMIVIGPSAASLAKENLVKLPIVFTMVNYPKSLKLHDRNIAGVSIDVPVEEFFKSLKDISPNSRRIISFYSSNDTEYAINEGDYFDIKHKMYYTKKKIIPSELNKNLEEIKGQYDAFLIISDPLFNRENFETISEFCSNQNMILISPFPALVKSGATFGLAPDYAKIGVETGNMVNRILSKKSSVEKEGILLPDQPAFFINQEYAKKSGLEFPAEIKERAATTKLFAAGISLLNEGKYKSARTIFENILKKDANNQAASNYLQLVIEKTSGTKVKQMLNDAENYYQKENYASAKSEYQKILIINPNLQIAKEGYKNSINALSEQERFRAQSLTKSGKPFEAIKMYLSSLRTLPSNNKSQAELATLRSQESGKVSEYLKSGIQDYTERNYESAIQTFENIILVNPNEKSAQEYLRLSFKKQEAVKVLQSKLNQSERNER